MAKTEDKYSWQVGHPPPILDQHSAVKHSIVEHYVQQYIETLMSLPTMPKLTLTLVDGFAGGGEYLNEKLESVDGTPLLMMRGAHVARANLNVGRRTLREVDAEFFFVEKKRESAEHLLQHLEKRRAEGAIARQDFERFKVLNAGFLDELPKIVERIKARRGGARAIFLLDQYSYNAVPMDRLRWLMTELPNAEVIMTFNVDSLLTYISDREANRKAVRNIGIEQYIPWNQLGQIKAESGRAALQRYVAQGIKAETGAPFMTLFFVRPDSASPWTYWLVHLSRQYKAHDVMKSLHWEHSSEFGHELEPGLFMLGYDPKRDEQYTGQSILFDAGGAELCIETLKDDLGRILSGRQQPLTVRQLLTEHISNTIADETRLQMVIRGLHAEGNILVSNKEDRKRRPSMHYNASDIIEYSPQRRFFR
ncbi:three-Cys-motif partner protein TcmP [Caballeronia sp. LZ034LL]|uniref:three-Cys-motif partner protein TcmP n=1 Tax=Caballeronia sp. LZ034LL TaxID=3038567 RepID=UPI00285CAB76|nr:three-Cys-motif partner protein TcmP [Caballeronia sp. LZ034LL]MDR5835133.1 three-Cys-motif partner protein TcmP [Caballeronia sp. LZ034LL]